MFSNIIYQLQQMSVPSSIYVQHTDSGYLNPKAAAEEKRRLRATQIAQLGQEALKLLEQEAGSAEEREKNYGQLAKALMESIRAWDSLWEDTKEEMPATERGLRSEICEQMFTASTLSNTARVLAWNQESAKAFAKSPHYQLAFVCDAVLDSKMIGSKFYDGGMQPTAVNVLMLEHLSAYRNQLTDPAKQQQIDRLIHDLEKQQKYANITTAGLSVHEARKKWLAREVWADIQKLQPGERVVVQGGYVRHRTIEVGHAAEYVIERQTNGKLSFTIINTGEGVDLVGDRMRNFCRILAGFNLKVYDCVWKDIEPDQMSQAFLEQLLEPRLPSGPRTDMATIISGVEAALQKKAGRGRLHNIQKHGSCVVKSLVSSIHERLPPATFWEFKAFYTERELVGLDAKLDASNLSKTLSPKEFAQAKDQFKAEAQEVLKKRQKKSRQANQPPVSQPIDEMLWLNFQ